MQVAVRPVAATGLPGGFDVTWDSPTEGPLTFGSTVAPLTVKGAVVPIDNYPRYDNPWSQTPFDAQVVKIADRPERRARLRDRPPIDHARNDHLVTTTTTTATATTTTTAAPDRAARSHVALSGRSGSRAMVSPLNDRPRE